MDFELQRAAAPLVNGEASRERLGQQRDHGRHSRIPQPPRLGHFQPLGFFQCPFALRLYVAPAQRGSLSASWPAIIVVAVTRAAIEDAAPRLMVAGAGWQLSSSHRLLPFL